MFRGKTISQFFAVFLATFVWAVTDAQSAEPPISSGTVLARVIGPNKATPKAPKPGEPITVNTFLVSLEILGSKDGYAPELIGKICELETEDFYAELIGKSINLSISKDKDGYRLMCTHVGRAGLAAGDKTVLDLMLKRQPKP